MHSKTKQEKKKKEKHERGKKQNSNNGRKEEKRKMANNNEASMRSGCRPGPEDKVSVCWSYTCQIRLYCFEYTRNLVHSSIPW